MKRFQFFLLTTACCAALPAVAQDALEGRDAIVVVAAGVEQRTEDTGRSITVLDRATIETRQTVALSDLLATTPGVTVSRTGGQGAVTTVRIRGAEGDQTLVLINGVRANDPSSPGGAYDFGNLLAGAVERVEVLRGPNSVVWGSQALGGVVNIVTRRPATGLSANGNAEYGSDDQFSGNAMLGYSDESVQAALSTGYLRTDGVSQASSGTEADGYRQFNMSGRLRADFAPGIGIDLEGYFTDSRLELDGYAPPSYSFGDTAEYSKTRTFYGYAGLHAETGPAKHRLGFSLGDTNRDNFDPANGTAPSFFGRGRSERYEYRGDAAVSKQLRLVFGAEHEDTRYFDGFDNFDAGVTSVYGQAIFNPIERVTVTAGLRNDDHKAYGSHLTFAASVAATLAQGTTLQASYGEGFKSPTLYQLYSDYGTRSLVPETARSYEVGIRQDVSGWLALGATWFHRDTRNQIDFQNCSGAEIFDPASVCYQRPYGTYNNIARTRAEGIEIEALARPVTGLSIRGSYTHVIAENRSPGANFGKDLSLRPQDTGSISVDYRLPFDLSVGGTLQVVSESYDNAGNTRRLEGYTLASLRAEMPVTEQVALYGRIENLFDEQYQTVFGYGTQGRTAYAGVRLRFN